MLKSFNTTDPIRLVIRQTAGPVVVTAGDAGSSTVEIAGPGEDEYRVDFSGGVLTVEAPKPFTVFRFRETSVTVTVPTGTAIDLASGAGKVALTGAFGAGTIKTGAGDIQVDQVAASMKIQSGAGTIRLDKVTAETRVSLGAGNITAEDVSADLDVTAGPGTIKVTRISRGNLTAKGTAGDMTVGVAAGVPTWTDLHTIGRIASTLPPVGAPGDGQDHVELRLSTAVGSITLQPA